MAGRKNTLREDSAAFAVRVSELCESIRGNSVYCTQLIRASSSVGANISEARYAQSTADLINKLEVALKECAETEYWLEVLCGKGLIDEEAFKHLRNDCGSIRRRLIASVSTAKKRLAGK